ncbi:CoA transferase [Cryobacterium sp. BB736]|uniref:CaiB/BaiF CoA transferase family protein n=1 Tax=Cryobacterium sp. BB736 TaxID=2746963 RepID=UPI001873E3A9
MTGVEGPLAGVRVADFSRVLAGPYATMMLADLGADVIKIESPAGDDTRHWVPPVDGSGTGTYFASVNRNKRSVVCDLRSDDGRQRALELAVGADIVVENFRPGTMESFGLGYDTLRAQNPRLVYASITGFGAGAGAELPGYDLLVQAVGGLMSITGEADGEPTKAGVALVDVLTGLNASAGILAALRHAERTGGGQRVEVNLLSSLLAGLVNQASSTIATGVSPQRMGNAHPSIAPYETLHTADVPIAVAVGNDRQFRDLVTVLGSPALADDPRFADNASRVANRGPLREQLERGLAGRPADDWVSLLTAARVPAGRVNTIAEAFALAGELGLGNVIELTDETTGATVRQVANPLTFSVTPTGYHRPPPTLGGHPDADWRADLPK